MQFDESKHPRDGDGKFAKQNSDSYSDGVNERIKWAKENGVELPYNHDGSLDDVKLQILNKEKANPKVVKVRMDTAIQKCNNPFLIQNFRRQRRWKH